MLSYDRVPLVPHSAQEDTKFNVAAEGSPCRLMEQTVPPARSLVDLRCLPLNNGSLMVLLISFH